jgi:hypothetical protein
MSVGEPPAGHLTRVPSSMQVLASYILNTCCKGDSQRKYPKQDKWMLQCNKRSSPEWPCIVHRQIKMPYMQHTTLLSVHRLSIADKVCLDTLYGYIDCLHNLLLMRLQAETTPLRANHCAKGHRCGWSGSSCALDQRHLV